MQVWRVFGRMVGVVDKKMFGSNWRLYIFASPLRKRIVLNRMIEEKSWRIIEH
jgi:hypothetical protein